MQTNATVFIGIDPGYERLGVAVLIKDEQGKDRLLFSDCLRSSAKLPFPDRLFSLGEELEHLFQTHQAAGERSFVALEKVYFNTNQKTATAVAEVRGMCMYLAKRFHMEVLEFTPSEIKVAIAGSGNAQKAEVQRMLTHLITLSPKKNMKGKVLDDELDAIAIALTASATYRG